MEFEVIFQTKITAKSKSDMERKAEEIASKFTKAIHKQVIAKGYLNVDEINDQTKLM